MVIDVSAYKTLYLSTARKLIDEYISIKNGADTDHTVQDLLRIFHSLKGQSMAMGYKNIAVLSLEVETFFRKLSENRVALGEELKKLLPDPKILLDDLSYIERTNEEISLVKETEATRKLSEGIKQKQLTILLVEDDPFFQKICIDKLKERSVLVDFSDNGEDAIARIAAKKYDCILLDIILPKKNGFDVLNYAKDNNIIPSTPIIVLSTLGQEDSIQKCLSMGAIDYINKANFNFDLLLSKINTAVSKGI
jgi:CheY-like chemotaxis protein